MYVPRSHDDKNDREDSNLLHLFLVVDSVLREQYVYRFRFVLFFVLSEKGAWRSRDESHHSYFSDLYESYKVWCGNRHPVQDIRNYVAEKTQQLHNAEQSAERRLSESLSNMYAFLIEKDGTIDKQLTALSHKTQTQLADVWNSMWKMKERLQTASDISTRRKALRQQLKSYRQTLAQMRGMATAVPSKQMADLMRKITQCYEALEVVERSAMDAFMQVTGYVGKSLLNNSKEPPRYLK